MENQHVMSHLSKRISSNAIMVTDTYAPYKNFAETENIQIEQILSERHAKGAFNLGAINALHSRLSAFWPKSAEREPATKYLDLQLMLFWWLEKKKDLSIREQVETIYSYLSEQYYKHVYLGGTCKKATYDRYKRPYTTEGIRNRKIYSQR